MKHAPSKKTAPCRAATRTQKTLLPLVAVGGSLAGSPASALELGDMTVQSRLGQPLRASIAYVLAPQEQLLDTCVSLGPGISSAGLPGIGPAKISVANGVISLSGQTPLREPMVAAHIVVDCNYMVRINREYTLFIDPADRSINDATAVSPATLAQPVPALAAARQSAASRPASESRAADTRRAPAATTVKRAPIGKSSQYRVKAGDSLSRIAERIQNRPVGLWPAVNLIFEANPHAFINNDPNMLMAGSVLTIPSFDGSKPLVRATTASGTSSTRNDSELYAREERPVDNSVVQSGTVSEVVADKIATPVATETLTVADGTATIDETFVDASSDLSPVSPVVDIDNPFVESPAAASSEYGIPDTELAGPRTLSSSPNVPTAVITTGTAEKSSSSWLIWLAGSGVAIIIALLLFGRLFRKRDKSAIAPMAYQPPQAPADAPADDATASVAMASDIDSDSPTEENLSLDADLVVGDGLEAGSHMDAAQDFGFASPTTVDFELPPQSRASADETILDSEILPEDEDYDLSVIIDATKMPQPEDITHRDLKAIELGGHDLDSSGNYTINREVDFDILAQDYEDEFTATQAVNSEIMKAASDLVNDLDENSTDAWLTTEETVLMTAEEETAMMESQGDSDATEMTAEMVLHEEEVTNLKDNLALSDTGTMGMLLEQDYTLEMAAAENDDDTREMEIDEDTVDTKAL